MPPGPGIACTLTSSMNGPQKPSVEVPARGEKVSVVDDADAWKFSTCWYQT